MCLLGMVVLNFFPSTSDHFLYYKFRSTSGDPTFLACRSTGVAPVEQAVLEYLVTNEWDPAR